MSETDNKKYKQGKFRPRFPQKYKGDPTNIIYRSSYELKFMNYCDLNESVREWRSEEFFIPYVSPIDNKVHRYFPDFFIKYKERIILVEIKPQKDLKMPEQNPKKRTKSWAYRVKTWAINQAKWKAAKEFCEDRMWEFKIFTEKELGIEVK